MNLWNPWEQLENREREVIPVSGWARGQVLAIRHDEDHGTRWGALSR